MNNKVHYTTCPVCDSNNINPLLTVKDYTVSGEAFVIWQCGNCSLRFTQDVPDENSIGAYYQSQDYISHTNTGKGLVNQLYQKVRQFTLNQKAKLIVEATGKEKGSLLDVGCGVGAFLNVMKKQGWQAAGIEPDAGARKIAKQTFDIDVLDGGAPASLPQNTYNAITLWHVLEHVHQLHNYMDTLKNLLQPDGKIFIAVPNYQSLDADIYRLAWAAYDVPRHLYHFTPKSMDWLVQKHGLKIIAKKPMWFDSFYVSLLSSKYRNGKTGWLSAVVNGFRSNIKAVTNTDYCSSITYVISKND